jgi:hypothetical protein
MLAIQYHDHHGIIYQKDLQAWTFFGQEAFPYISYDSKSGVSIVAISSVVLFLCMPSSKFTVILWQNTS